MDLNKKIPLEKHHNFEIQQQWVPTTPVRATTELSQRPPGPRWLEPTVMLANGEFPCQSGSSISSGIHNHLKANHYTTFLDSSSHASSGSVVMLHAPSTSSSNVNSLDCWSPLMYNNVDLASNVIETSKMPPCPSMLVQIDSRQEMPSTQNMFLLQGKVMLASNSSYRRCLCCCSHNAEYGLPAISIHNCDSLPESVMSVSRKITLSDPSTPATTEKFNKRIQYKKSSLEVTGFVDEGEGGENLMATEVSLCHPELKRLRSCDISLLNKGTSDQLLGVEMINVERDTKGIDLNVIRKKRSPRKKHRPKVFKEGRPSRTPKPTTSDTDEKNSWKDNTSCKRKYVWRNKDVTLSLEKENSSCKRKYVRRHKDVAYSSETAANTLGEIVDIECKDKAKSPRRCLNFDMEESKVLEELSVATSEFKNLVGAFGRDVCDGSAVTSLRKKAVHSTKVDDQVAVKPLTFSASDPNNSKYHSQKECLQQISVPSSEVNKNICALDKKLPPLKFSIKHFKGVAKNATCFDLAPLKSSSDVFQKNLNSNGMSDAPPRGKKRCHLSIDEAEVLNQKRFMHAYTFRGCSSKSCDIERQGLYLTKFHNTLIINKEGLGKSNPSFSSQLLYTTSDTLKMKQLTNNPLKFTFIDARSFVAQEKAQTSECILLHEQKEDHVVKKPHFDSGQGCLNSTSTCSRKFTPVKQFRKKTKEKFQPPTPEKVPKFKVTFVNKSRGHQSRETSEDIKSSKQAQGLPLLTMSSCTKQTYVEEHEEARSNGVSSKQKNVERGFLSNRGLAGALAPLIDMVDIIVQKLRQLHISRCHQFATYHPNNAIVPYGRHEFMMVPYDINFELTKKRRPRAKVDLDSESNRIWKLLMGKDCSKGDEQPDVDKEKWWVEERRVFQGRVDSFIARMHLVQGDRRFSLWKGSVVDSVVGVFLTQNVSDHLSSSAFMSLAANFPLRPRGKCGIPKVENVNASMEIQNRCIMSLTDSQKLQRNLFGNGSFRSSFEVGVSHNGNEKETSSCSETLGSNTGSSITYYSRQKGRVKGSDLCRKEVILCQQSTVTGSGINIADVENVRLSEDVVTSQDSVLLSQNSIGFNPDLNIEADNLVSGSMNDFVSTSLTELLDISERNDLKEVYNHVSGMISEIQNQESVLNIGNSSSLTSQLDNSKDTFQSCNADSILNHATISLPDMLLPEKCNPSDDLFSSKIMVDASHSNVNIRSHLLPISCDITSGDYFDFMSRKCSVTESTNPHKLLSSSTTAITIDSVRKQTTRHVTLSEVEVGADLSSRGHKDTAVHTISTTKNENSHVCTILDNEVPELFQQENKISLFEPDRTLNAVRALEKPCSTQQVTVSSNGIEQNSVMPNKSGPRLNVETCSFAKVSRETTNSAIPTRKIRPEVEKSTYDWESLRKEVCCSKQAQERSSTTVDSLDWEAVRTADVSKIAETIRGRGMNNVLAERIQEFLNRLVREHGSIDLEWLRDVPPDKVKDYLLSIRGLGLKSAECVRLLTLQQLAFPVDTNVGRICVRLGWVPLQPLPESLQLHLLELYPVLASIQKYLWPRLCKLDQRTLYELHYQMITFGKVFCTKSKPNCNSCPMRGECRHFASAFASARLALPAPEEKSVVSLMTSLASEKNDVLVTNPTPLLQIEGSSHSQECGFCNNCVPIIEEPASPEPESQETLESAIEDAFYEDPDEIPSIKLNLKEFTQNLQNYMEENMVLQDGSLSKALVALTPEAASIPMPKLKNISRLRTEHHVFEIPDIHPLLEGLDPREPDDPSPYLLAIWTPGETEQSTDPPKANCNLLDVDQPCENTCFAINNIQEAESHKVRGTLLIPCRTAMRGSFPLNGTYFQVNEVFADHHSSRNPIYVPRDWIWNLPRRTVFFGTSIPTIFRGLTTEGIQQCFWKGFVCVRGFDRVTRAPKPLYARLHFPASKASKRKNAEEPKVEK